MTNSSVLSIMKLINRLSDDLKLEVLSRLSESINSNIKGKQNSKEDLIEELFGSWEETEEDLAIKIVKSRTISKRKVSLDL